MKKRRHLSDLHGALPATRPFSSKEEVREEVGRKLGEQYKETPVIYEEWPEDFWLAFEGMPEDFERP